MPLWDKASDGNVSDYKHFLDNLLDKIDMPWEMLQCRNPQCANVEHIRCINMLTESLLNACADASFACIPHSHATADNTSSRQVPGWSEHVEPARQTALFWHFLWKENGCPQHGEVASIRRRTRAQYHLAVRKVKRLKDTILANNMANSLKEKDNNGFWKAVRRANYTKSSLPSSVDTAQCASEISNLFADKYKLLYNSVSYNVNEMSVLLADIDKLIDSKCHSNACGFNHSITVATVTEAVRALKLGKHDGNNVSHSDHFIHGTSKLNAFLSLLMSSMLCHGHAPDHLLVTTIIPIVKDKRKSNHDSNNYRGIALSSILGKLIDIVIIKSQAAALSTSDMQFGFKEKCSTSQCTFVVKEVINYYVSGKSDIYCVMLDASKAFDRVNFVKLFTLLVNNNLCPTIARFLALLYTRQQCKCKWGSELSNSFEISNGVKQGGVLSPLLFSSYIDVLLSNLRNSGYGCHIGNTFMGAFAYADDVILLCPTVGALKQLLSICESFSVEYDIMFNATKSKLLTFGNHSTNINIQFQGSSIPHVSSESHLGHLFGSDPDIPRKVVSSATHDMFNRLNLLLRQFCKADCDLKYYLFKVYCMSVYGSQLWNFESKHVKYFYTGWRKAIRRIYNVSNMTHCAILPYLCQDDNVDTQLHARFVKFVYNSLHSKNVCITLACKLALYGSQSDVCASINFISTKYRFNKYQLADSLCKSYITPAIDETSKMTAGVIRDFIVLNRNYNDDNLNEIIEFLCTS